MFDQRTDGWTEGQTKRVVESRARDKKCQKKKNNEISFSWWRNTNHRD